MNLIRSIFIIIALIFSAIPLHSQSEEEGKYKLAQSYEKSGDYLSAQRLYLELYNSHKYNEEYFDALKRTYMALNQYSEFLEIVRERFEDYKSPKMYALLGELLWRTGDIEKANEIWNEALEDQRRTSVYVDIAEAQISLLLFEKAIETFLRAREETGNPALFADELSQLYIAVGDYAKGTSEVLTLFERTADLAKAEGRLSALMTSEDAIEHIDKMLGERSAGNSITYKQLYAWFLRQTDQLQEALDLIIEIDNMGRKKGKEIYDFARQSLFDEQYDIALKAFGRLIEMGNETRYYRNARYEYVRTLEKKLTGQEDFSGEEIMMVIDEYENLISGSESDRSDRQGKYRIAWLYYKYLNDNEKAIEYLTELVDTRINDNVNGEANLLLGDIYFEMDQKQKAKTRYEILSTSLCRYAPVECYEAKLRLADMMYYSGNIDSARSMYIDLTDHFNMDYMNDAMEKIVLIDQNKSNEFALATFAKAEQYETQKKYDEAIATFKKIIDEASYSDLAERSYIKIVKIFQKQKMYDKARVMIEEFLDEYDKSIFGDYALLTLGDIYMKQNKKEEAIDQYKKLLVDYPRSIYLQEARTKIRRARGENL